MLPLRIIDLDFNLIDEITQYASLQSIRKWHEIGEIEVDETLKKQKTHKKGTKLDIINIVHAENGTPHFIVWELLHG
ncbi:hypothetical protein [Rummeliibacillus stabekisii]|uniref:hypothetical protein n=1 Tax=Rummeliibacillus stabekisii TaxID=241244 RepID=UPI00116F5FAF|nr:hypothetical protein [Rummeliibacillus stabekisii]MBB5171621.1 hypothetical protein [Rummeliibacillus stabekisii]GEL05467.1 hypothetical protein RST01_20940 [Rummeliibacillus stabekisii]